MPGLETCPNHMLMMSGGTKVPDLTADVKRDRRGSCTPRPSVSGHWHLGGGKEEPDEAGKVLVSKGGEAQSARSPAGREGEGTSL